MELLRRALLVGFMLPAIWFSRLATLDPLVSIVSLEPAIPQARGGGSESSSVSGPRWDHLLGGVDALDHGLGPENRWRAGAGAPVLDGVPRWVFFKPEEIPTGGPADRLATPGGTVTVSISRPDGDLRYRIDRQDWSRQEFGPDTGFTGKPAPPDALLYPFQYLAYACLLAGIALFAVLQGATRSRGAPSPGELGSLALALLFFAAPLVATGGSVQALTRGLRLTIPCWIFAGVAIHRFARPEMSARRSIFPLPALASGGLRIAAVKVPFPSQWELAMLGVAIGPLAVLVSASLAFWNR